MSAFNFKAEARELHEAHCREHDEECSMADAIERALRKAYAAALRVEAKRCDAWCQDEVGYRQALRRAAAIENKP